MRHHSFSTAIFAAGLLTGATAAQAANESWVSGTGTDAGTCPRTAPCRTFQFAHDQTNNNGAINVLASGNFGPLTISKPISIVAQGAEAVINTAANGAAITVQAGGGANVSLRGLTIDMRGTGNKGINFLSGAALHVWDTVIRKTTDGISFAPASGTPELYVANSIFEDAAGASQGIIVVPSGSAGARVVLNSIRAENSGNGVLFDGGSTTGSINATVRDSVFAGNTGSGIAVSDDGGVANVMIDRSAMVNNTSGLSIVNANNGDVWIGDSTVTGNGTGLNNGSNLLVSYGTNKVNGNGTDGAANGVGTMK